MINVYRDMFHLVVGNSNSIPIISKAEYICLCDYTDVRCFSQSKLYLVSYGLPFIYKPRNWNEPLLLQWHDQHSENCPIVCLACSLPFGNSGCSCCYRPIFPVGLQIVKMVSTSFINTHSPIICKSHAYHVKCIFL